MNKDKYPVLVDKYICKTYNNRYRLFIRSGNYYFYGYIILYRKQNILEK